MTLTVDNRERLIIEESVKRKVPHRVAVLDIGDYHITDPDDKIIGIWERKTYADLAASVTDKRYQEQKLRLMSSPVPCKGYILEGQCPKGTFHGLQPGTVDSIRIGLQCRDGFKVLTSDGIVHTVTILEKLMKKLPEYQYQDHFVGNYQQILVDSAVSTVKKENLTPETCYLAQLAQIPQISYHSAKAIYSRFPNMTLLLAEINTNRDVAIAVISDIKVTDRRLGRSVAANVCDYLAPIRAKIVIKKIRNT